jgi:hypothetical protein
MKHQFDHQFFREISMYQSDFLSEELSRYCSSIYINTYKKGADFARVKNDGINHWALRDIIFWIIKRPKNRSFSALKTLDKDQFIRLIRLFNDYENELHKKYVNHSNVRYLLHSIGVNQFPSQDNTLIKLFQINYLILTKINNKLNNYIDVNEPFIRQFGCDFDEYNKILLQLLLYSKQNHVVADMQLYETFEKNISIEKEIIKSVINYYTCNIDNEFDDEINYLKNRFLFLNNGSNTFNIDPYSIEQAFSKAGYWIIRDFYNSHHGNNKIKNEFTNKFGLLFEEFVFEMITITASKHNSIKAFKLNEVTDNYDYFKKIKGKIADFYFETPNLILVIEAKSSIEKLEAKNIYNNEFAITEYIEKTFLEANYQLNNTLSNIDSDKPKIGVVLYYQQSYSKNFIRKAFLSDKMISDSNNLIIDIVEFLKFLSLIIYNIEIAENILTEFFETNFSNDANRGKDLYNHLEKFKEKYDCILDNLKI